jgi:Flp pilus assembly protein TadG
MTTPTQDTGHETAYERGLRHGGSGSNSSGGGGSMGFLTKPIGPLPLWVWLVLGIFAAFGYYIWSKKSSANTTSTASNTSTGTGTTDSSLIPQFVNQVYTNQGPPETPLTTASGQGGSSGTGTGTGTTTTSTGTGGNSSTTNSSVKIPNVVGLDAEQAIQVLQSAGLHPEITLTPASNKPGIFHIVTKTGPAQVGQSVAPGTVIKLYYKDSKNM